MDEKLRNIETFDLMAADILVALLKEFPIPAAIQINSTMKRILPHLSQIYPEGVEVRDTFYWYVDNPEKEHECLVLLNQFWDSTATWLRKTNYIEFDDDGMIDVGVLTGAVLTPKGLEVLNAKVDSLDPGRSIGSVLSDAAVWSGKETGKIVIKRGIEAALGFGLKIWT